ncbi:MAG: DUF6226 family protein, partial [Actinomycetota bacterium]
REEGVGLDPQIESERPPRPTVRLVPDDPDAGVLTVAFTSFPGLRMRMGRWLSGSTPYCGCDACDETLDEARADLEQLIGDLTAGRVREAIDVPGSGDGRLVSRIGASRGWGALERADAVAMVEAASGRTEFTYGPWPPR